MKTAKHDAIILSGSDEKETLARLTSLLGSTPLPPDELLANLGLFLTSKNLSRLLFFYEIYKLVAGTHGIICEFGVRWGQNMALLSALRGIFEPFNRHRRIVGFDTFDGFCGLSGQDGDRCKCKDGSFSVSKGYEDVLAEIIGLHDALNPIPHLRKYEIVKGDARLTVPQYFADHPEALVSMAVFDFDIYEPTKAALEAVAPRLFKGSVLVFDELADDIFPGETVAVMEVLGVRNLRIQRMPMTARVCYAVVE